jgi:hypothetical protein
MPELFIKKKICLHTDNQALAWLLQHAKELGRVGPWVLRLAPFKFRVCHVSGKNNVVAEDLTSLTRQYENLSDDATFAGLVLQHLPEAFQSVRERQKKDPCPSRPAAKHFTLFNGNIFRFRI